MFAIAACIVNGIPKAAILDGIRTFKPLAHRMEYVGCFNGFHYYNDSIATIPEATMAAVAAIPNIGTLILGGFDRGIDYVPLAEFLAKAAIDDLVFMGDAGLRMISLMQQICPANKKMHMVKDLTEAMALAKKYTAPGKAILLSPAAASYDRFRNFEERGTAFKQLASS
jgi:UDP-N-acetylmuramoylalanine--D-glutamate ligase